jgi:hypothetical protein
MENQSNQTDNEPNLTRTEELKRALVRMSDELELKAHLGKMELEQAVEEARPRVESLRRRVRSSGGRAADELRLQLAKIDERLEDLESRIVRA